MSIPALDSKEIRTGSCCCCYSPAELVSFLMVNQRAAMMGLIRHHLLFLFSYSRRPIKEMCVHTVIRPVNIRKTGWARIDNHLSSAGHFFFLVLLSMVEPWFRFSFELIGRECKRYDRREREKTVAFREFSVAPSALWLCDGSLINLLSGGGEDGVISIIKQERFSPFQLFAYLKDQSDSPRPSLNK